MIPICIPEGVEDATAAFRGCKSLTEPSSLPEGIVNISNIYATCEKLEYTVAIPSTVANMSYAFHACVKITDLPSAIPEAVTNMEGTFRLCYALNGIIEINSLNVAKYTDAFYRAGRDAIDGVKLTGSCPQL
jgi:hypothetical protein